jgi:ribosomal protein S18 acetylase RimI-like enzyme
MELQEYTIKSLKGLHFADIYQAHLKAFKDYPFQWSKEALQHTIIRRGFSPELSFGAFHNDTLVSFTLNGIGMFNGIKTAYDTGTGTAELYRGKGLASKIFEYSVPHLRAAGIKQYLLEVLTNNAPAQSVYTKQGFSVTRTFHCFRTESNKWKIPERFFPKDLVLREISLDIKVMAEMHDFLLSWQNSFESLERNTSHVEIIGAFLNNILVGYGIIEPGSGDIPQLAVKKGERKNGIGTAILSVLQKRNRADIVKVINIPSGCKEIKEFLVNNGIPEVVTQYEMIREL